MFRIRGRIITTKPLYALANRRYKKALEDQ
jgi:hypothetical protein